MGSRVVAYWLVSDMEEVDMVDKKRKKEMSMSAMEIIEPRGTIKVGEYHPAADSAMEYVKSIPYKDLAMWLEAFSSCAIEGNRLGEICSETLNRVMTGQVVSDRYLLGLAWTLKFNMPKYSKDTYDVTLCKQCNCMTKTIDKVMKVCGKCGCYKEVKDAADNRGSRKRVSTDNRCGIRGNKRVRKTGLSGKRRKTS